MFNLHITLAMVVTGLTDIVDRFGSDHIGAGDTNCVYVRRQEGVRLIPECIVGQFFSDLGILRVLVGSGSIEFYGSQEVEGVPEDSCPLRNGGGVIIDFREVMKDFGITFDDDAFTFLAETQFKQDHRTPWGEAVEHAAQVILDSRGEPYQSAVQRLAASL